MTKKTKTGKLISFGFYWRKLAIFGCFFIVAVFIVFGINSYKADSLEPSVALSEINSSVSNITILSNGNYTINGKNSGKLSILKDYDEIRIPVVDNPGNYIDDLTVNLTLPADVASKVHYEILAIHGVDNTSTSILDPHTIVYRAYNIGPAATVSIVAELPKGVIKYNFIDQILYTLRQLGVQQWLFISLLIPIISVVIMVWLISRQLRLNRSSNVDYESDNPPMALPPAIVGVLYRQKVTSREIAATLIDLAIRGDIYIIDRERDFAFIKNRYDQRLISYEKVLLSKIFNEKVFSNKEEIEKKINEHLYSKKISLFSTGLYNLATRLGYFKVNPQQVHVRYRLYGIISFLFSLAGFLVTLNFLDYRYLSFIWVAMMVTALVVTFLAQKIPIRSSLGQGNLDNWLAFRKFLSSKEKIPFSYADIDTFQKFLPYAIAMDCEVAWAKRFSELNFEIPKWFISNKNGFGLQDFCLSLFPIVSYISRSFAAIREPGFE